MGFLVVLVVGGVLVVAVATILVLSIWRLIAKRPSKGTAIVDLVIAFAFGLYLVRAVHWWATETLLASEWEHLAIPLTGLAIFGSLAALHHRGVQRDPLRV